MWSSLWRPGGGKFKGIAIMIKAQAGSTIIVFNKEDEVSWSGLDVGAS